MWEQGNSALSGQFGCELKTAFKYNVYLKKTKTKKPQGGGS